MRTFLLAVFLIGLNVVLWTQFPPDTPRLLSKLRLDPPPAPYVWYRINPETDITCLVVESQYNAHSIAMWCERLTDADHRPVFPFDAR